MNKRQTKKLMKQDRCEFLADKLCTMKRGYNVEYFLSHPADFSAVKKLLKKRSQFLYQRLLQDVKTCYHHSNFDAKEYEQFVENIRCIDFQEYVRLKKSDPIHAPFITLPTAPRR